MDNNWAHNTNIMVLPFVTDVCSDQRSLHLIPCHTTKLLQLILATWHSQFLQAGMTIRQTMKRSNNFYWLSLPTVHYLTLLKNQFSSRDFQRTSHWVLELSSNLYLLLMILNAYFSVTACIYAEVITDREVITPLLETLQYFASYFSGHYPGKPYCPRGHSKNSKLSKDIIRVNEVYDLCCPH